MMLLPLNIIPLPLEKYNIHYSFDFSLIFLGKKNVFANAVNINAVIIIIDFFYVFNITYSNIRENISKNLGKE